MSATASPAKRPRSARIAANKQKAETPRRGTRVRTPVKLVATTPTKPKVAAGKSRGRPRKNPVVEVLESSSSEDETEYVIEKIVNQRTNRKRLQYQVKWENFDDLTWEPAENLEETIALEVYLKESSKNDATADAPAPESSKSDESAETAPNDENN